MKESLLKLVVCPGCKSRLVLNDGRTETGGNEILEGRLDCLGCRRGFPVRNGIPVLLVSADYQELISRSFGFQWRMKRIKMFEAKTVYGRDAEKTLADFYERLSLRPEEIRGKRILDAGCGSGMLAHALSAAGCEVVGVDLSHPIEAFELNKGLVNAHIVTADIFQLPFADGTFDVAWSEGVLHHTPDPPRAFKSLQRILKRGGTGYVWVYSKSPRERIRKRLHTPDLPGWLLVLLCYLLVIPYAIWQGLRIIMRFRGTAFAFFDALSPRYQSAHGRKEVQGWFQSAGFERIDTTEDRGTFWQAVWGVGVKK
jgi:SAM-dependent methyltransferase